MIKKGALLFCVLMLAGCSSYGQNYFKNPEALIRDPHFTDYKNKRDALELEYVHKEITYAEYIQQRDRLDETYDRQVQERTDKIMSPEK